jgi:LPPG:FO 2-phospho-L-lactate transferase
LELRIAVLAGGVGGAKFLQGLSKAVSPRDLSCVVNTGDDIILHGLHISPDLDIITYTLAGVVDYEKGWGIHQDTFNCLDSLKSLGSEEWFGLGDKDLATHLYRTQLLSSGLSLSEVTTVLSRHFGVESSLLPMTNDKFETWIRADVGWMHFEEYYVRRAFRDNVTGVEFRGAENARPAPGVVEALSEADLVIIAPSNPIVSIGTILAVDGVREALRQRDKPVVAISPIVGGSPLKGPADKLMSYYGVEVSPRGVAKLYEDFLDILILDSVDAPLVSDITFTSTGIEAIATNTIMSTTEDKICLAKSVLEETIHRQRSRSR